MAVAAPHATLEGPTALDVLFPAAIAPSPVAGEDSAGDLVLHVALVTGSLYRISLALPLVRFRKRALRYAFMVECFTRRLAHRMRKQHEKTT